MSSSLQSRIARIRHALGVTRSEDIKDMRVVQWSTPTSKGIHFDANQGRSPADLEYAVYSLVASIASLKDHLRHWCTQSGIGFGGDRLIDSNIDVAVVHDLWNMDKHAELNRPPRSGKRLVLVELSQTLQMSTGTGPNSGVAFTIDLRTGKPQVISSGGGSASLVVDARVVDENGTKLGSLQEICARAVAAWEAEMAAVGVRLGP